MKTTNKEVIRNKLEQAKWRVKGDILKVKVWAEQNPEKAVAIASTGVAVAQYFGKTALKDIRTNREAAMLKRRCYDPSKGHYYYLKRELTNQEWLMIDKRRDAGEKLPDILEEMKVLK
jgi:hypothetical protein